MQTIHTNVYPYDELQPAAQEKAREWYRRGLEGDNYFAESVEEDAKQCVVFLGLTVDKIYWSGFSSQGDGACFEGSWSASKVVPGGIKEHAPQDEELHRIGAEFERIAKLWPGASFSVKHSGRYYHRGCTSFDFSWGDDPESNLLSDEQCREYQNELHSAALDFMDWIYASLEREWNYMNSDEQVVESILANEYTFTAEGKRFG